MDLSKYAFVDTETDNLSPEHMPWEIAVITYERTEGEAVGFREVNFIVNDFDVNRLDPKAAEVNHYHERHKGEVGHHWSTHSIIPVLGQILRGKMLVGSNPGFDEVSLINLGLNPVWSHRKRDIPSMYLGATGEDAGGMEGVAEALGITNKAPHTAMGDASATLAAFLALTKKV